MTIWHRIRNVLSGVALILISVALFVGGEKAYPFVLGLYALTLELYGLRILVFYFKMARYMVGGKTMLYRGILLLDLGAFAGSLINVPQMYILLYLCGTLAFSGIVDVLRALESKRVGGSWRLKVSMGGFSILSALFCVIFLHSADMVVYIFCVSLIYSAIVRIINAFRPAPLIAIQ